jgi:stringent starvation protein B
MTHRVRNMVESLHAKSACPRLVVDATVEGAVCPDFLRERWQEELIIDLDPSYPLNLEFTTEGIEADLAFEGLVARCVFPYSSIYVVADRETGKGIVIEENMPESVRRKRQATAAQQRTAKPPSPRKRGHARGQSRRRRRPRPEPEPVAQPGLAPAPEADAEPEPTGEAREQPRANDTGDEEARRRRSVFKVIRGDG